LTHHIYGAYAWPHVNNDMLQKTPYKISQKIIEESYQFLAEFTDFKTPINEPTGDFFYDIWKIKTKFKGTVFETLLSALPSNIGEARIVKLDSGNCYLQHSDIDDRYHLNISGNNCYLLDLESKQLHELVKDGCWYEMDAGRLHSAINIGYDPRYQLVVRKLLDKNSLENYRKIKIMPICDKPRFRFDNHVSPWLNKAAKRHIIQKFKARPDHVTFQIDAEYLKELDRFDRNSFKISID
jgi:hypothetical protein